MLYRIAGGLYFIGVGVALFGLHSPGMLLVILALLAGIGLLIGL